MATRVKNSKHIVSTQIFFKKEKSYVWKLIIFQSNEKQFCAYTVTHIEWDFRDDCTELFDFKMQWLECTIHNDPF